SYSLFTLSSNTVFPSRALTRYRNSSQMTLTPEVLLVARTLEWAQFVRRLPDSNRRPTQETSLRS
ncbi:hypothetical protein PFISCL1PPCAC_21302, partial [Pristionchus fissidentatus]